MFLDGFSIYQCDVVIDENGKSFILLTSAKEREFMLFKKSLLEFLRNITMRINSITVILLSVLHYWQIVFQPYRHFLVEFVDSPALYLCLYEFLCSFTIQYKQGKSSDSSPNRIFNEALSKNLQLHRISFLSNLLSLYVEWHEFSLIPYSFSQHSYFCTSNARQGCQRVYPQGRPLFFLKECEIFSSLFQIKNWFWSIINAAWEQRLIFFQVQDKIRNFQLIIF